MNTEQGWINLNGLALGIIYKQWMLLIPYNEPTETYPEGPGSQC